jgi:hypothetical protein
MGFSTLSEAEEAEFTAIDKEISQIVGGLSRPPSERN